jgi:hypothetical protein
VDEFVDMGFFVASGATGVSANSAFEYPEFLKRYARGEGFKAAIKAGDTRANRRISDNAARFMGFSKVDSRKEIRGVQPKAGELTINHPWKKQAAWQ